MSSAVAATLAAIPPKATRRLGSPQSAVFLARAAPPVIVVAGEALVDLVPVAERGEVLYRANPGGGPFNTAVALGRLGVPTAFAGALSSDGFGQRLLAQLVDAGVDVSNAPVVDAPTPLAVVTIGGRAAENHYSFHLAGTALDAAASSMARSLEGASVLHVGTLATTVEPIATAVEDLVVREHERLVVGFDPNVRPLLVTDREAFVARVDRLAGLSDVVKVSDADADWLAPGPPEALATRWLRLGVSLVVVTLGAAGAEAWTSAGRVAHPGSPARVVDTVGAGDSFNGALLAWLHHRELLHKASLRSLSLAAVAEALRFAGVAAARTCERPGADPPWLHDLPEDIR